VRIALFHGYELTGSGSNEYTRYLALQLALRGHEVSVVCLEPAPERIDFVREAWVHGPDGSIQSFKRDVAGASVVVHGLQRPPILPVYVTDKERPGNVAAFVDLTDAQLRTYHRHMVASVRSALSEARPDVLHVNHTVWQPCVAAEVCPPLGIPFYVVPHGSAIEYTVREDERFLDAARQALTKAAGLVFISREVRQRFISLFPECVSLSETSRLIGIGTDTSLFSPVADRGAACAELVAMHREGGRPAALRTALAERVEALDFDDWAELRAGWDHHVEDEDFPRHLDALQLADDVVAFVGALTWGKGVQSLVAAMPRLLARRPGCHLLIVGSGRFREALEALVFALDSANFEALQELVRRGRSLEQPELEGELEDVGLYLDTDEGRTEIEAVKGRLAERVHIVGRLDHPRLSKLLGWARVAAFPSIVKEASPLVFAEALAAGVVPAASDHSGFHDGLEDLQPHLPADLWGPMHLPTDPRDRVRTIADRLDVLLQRTDDPDLPERLAEIARQRYDWTGIAQRLEAFVHLVRSATATAADALE
jgi:glycosyltransferase involved in cell wall biosynthesis